MTAAQQYEVEAVALGDGRAAVDCLGERIVVDASHPDGPLPDAARLLVASFAACMLENLEHTSTYLRFRYRHASIRVVAERGWSPPRLRRLEYELRLDTDEPPGRVELVHRNLLRFGTVTATLAEACEVEGTVTVREPAVVG